MAQKTALVNGLYTNGVRTRTPGKYIVLAACVPIALAALVASGRLNSADPEPASAAVEYRKSDSGANTAYSALPEFLVDLSPDLNGRTAYLKMRASVLLNDDAAGDAAAAVAAAEPAVMERLTFFLRALRPEDFAGTEGMRRVKREMTHRINLAIAPAVVDDVIIEELVIQ